MTALAINADKAKTVKRLWVWGLGMALAVATMIVGNCFVSADKKVTMRCAGHDFIAFYTAGKFVREGHMRDIYDLDKVKTFQHTLATDLGLELGESFGPFWNPPMYAWVFVPLARFTYPQAWFIWFIVNFLSAAAAIAILCRLARDRLLETGMDPTKVWQVWGVIPILVVTSLPFIQSIGHGQNTSISLLILSATVWFWTRNRPMTAGLVCGLLFYKPQLAAVVAGIMVLTTGWRALVGLAFSGSALLLVSIATMPGMIDEWLHKLPLNLKVLQIDHRYMWDRHVTLKAFWRLLVQGFDTGTTRPAAVILWVISVGILSFGLTLVVVRVLLKQCPRERLIAATFCAMPLLMPFFFDYDLLILAVPAVLFGLDRLLDPERTSLDRNIFLGWLALFAWMFLNPFVSRQTHVNITVIILSSLTAMLIVKACNCARVNVRERELSNPMPVTV